jgi:hypothetical protein
MINVSLLHSINASKDASLLRFQSAGMEEASYCVSYIHLGACAFQLFIQFLSFITTVCVYMVAYTIRKLSD